MPKSRPHIPFSVRVRVAERQLGMTDEQIDRHLADNKSHQRYLNAFVLPRLRSKLGVASLHLDHDPALENRDYRVILYASGSRSMIRYIPEANDPDHLIYREGGFKGSAHDIKTRIRGERGQFADNVIAKRERWRLKPRKPKKKIASRGFQKSKRKIQSRGFR